MQPSGTGRVERLADRLIAHRRWVVALVLAVSAGLGLAARGLRLEFRAADLLPQHHPFVAVHERWHHNFTEADTLTVMVEARHGTLFSVPVLAALWRVNQAVDRLPGVNHDQVSSLANGLTRWVRVAPGGWIDSGPIMTGPPASEADVEAIHRNVGAATYVLGSMLSLDQHAAIIRAGFIEKRLDYPQLFDAVNATILPLANDDVAIYVSGQPRLYGWILHFQTQVLAAFALAIVLTWICLHAYFHDWRGALRPTISGGLAALWGLGLMQLVGFALNPLLLVIPFLITARAVSHSAQMHDRYYEELERGTGRAGAISGSFGRLFAPTTAGILTDALGVLAIGLVDIPALRQLAVVAALWIFSLLVSELLLNPIVYGVLRVPDPATIAARERGWLARASVRVAAAVTGPRGRWLTLGATGVVTVAAVALLPLLDIGDPTSASRILGANSEYNRSHRAIQETFGGSEPFMVVVEGDEPNALERAGVLHTIEGFQRTLERDPVVGASFSLVDFQTSMAERFHELEPKWGVIPTDEKTIHETFFLYWGGVPPSTSARFFTPDFRTAHVTFFCRDHTVAHVQHLVAAARAFIDAHPVPHVQFRLAGGFIGIMAAVYDEILRSQALMTAASFLVILVVCAVTYRSVVAALLLVVPLGLANLVVNAYMAARGIGLDLNTLPVVAVGVGFGIDYGIYVLSRVQEGVAAGVALDAAVRAALARSGRTVVVTAFTMTIGILCFSATELRFAGEMAALLALWMVTSCTTAVTVLPALLVVLQPRFLRMPGRSALLGRVAALTRRAPLP